MAGFISRQGFYKCLANKYRIWDYQSPADIMMDIRAKGECNDTYGRILMYQALNLKQSKHV